jgi:MFS family permease
MRQRGVQTRHIRRGFNTVAGLAPAACLALMAATTQRWAVVALLIAARFVAAADVGGVGLVILDLFPEHAGALKGASCLWGNAPGILAPLFAGVMLDRGGCTSEGSDASSQPRSCERAWDMVLGLSSLMYVVGAALFFVGVSFERRYVAGPE